MRDAPGMWVVFGEVWTFRTRFNHPEVMGGLPGGHVQASPRHPAQDADAAALPTSPC